MGDPVRAHATGLRTWRPTNLKSWRLSPTPNTHQRATFHQCRQRGSVRRNRLPSI